MKERLHVNRPLEKLYFSIQEVSQKYGVAASKIRYWCDYFSVEVKRSTKKNRQFSRANIIELDKIHWLVEKEEFTLPGALKKLPTIKHSPYDTIATHHQDAEIGSISGSLGEQKESHQRVCTRGGSFQEERSHRVEEGHTSSGKRIS